jgi:hypothetical protein
MTTTSSPTRTYRVFRTVIAVTILMAMVPLPDGLSVRVFRDVFRRNRCARVDGFVSVQNSWAFSKDAGWL